MDILVTGAEGFVGKNLVLRLRESPHFIISTYSRGDSFETLKKLLTKADAVIHLAGENRPIDEEYFNIGNTLLTSQICDFIKQNKKEVLFFMASSTQASHDNPYGKSKLAAEKNIEKLNKETQNPVVICRLPGIFGKWCKPNYNSVVATFCYNIANELPIKIEDPSKKLRLVYIDNVIDAILNILNKPFSKNIVRLTINPEYSVTVGELSQHIIDFKKSRMSLITGRVGIGFLRALYSTYISYLPAEEFKYSLTPHEDKRGRFVEMLKTKDSGQLSYFTANPGVTRGGHYHHTKTEKFLVIKGIAQFRFKHALNHDSFKIEASGEVPCVVETIPGWSHDITNIGDDELIVMLWANENFDINKPDTILSEL
jgi:UDP-2-acetamido-2,6-beta-L-arabino-hexul-4-ose reductase